MNLDEFYDDRCRKHNGGWQASHWLSEENQRDNFSVLKLIGDTGRRTTVLDVGCGTGEFYEELRPAKYTGVDASREMIDRAKKKYPSAKFTAADFLSADFKGTWDYTLAAGTFNHAGQDIDKALEKMFACCNLGAGLILLSTLDPAQKTSPDPILQPHDPAKILEKALALTPLVNLNHAALGWGFIIFLYKPGTT